MAGAGATTVYLLCLATSALCAFLLVRSYLRTRTRLLLWSAACFVLLAFNNLLLVTDLVLTGPQVDLSVIRKLSLLAALAVLLIGFIWEAE